MRAVSANLRRWRSSRWCAVAAVGSLSVVFWAMPTASAHIGPSGGSSSACPGVSATVSVPVAPAGYVYLVNSELLANCTVASGTPTLESASAMAAALGLSTDQTAALVISNEYPALDPTATSYYRLWDVANNLLNGLYLTEQWSDNGTDVTSSSPYLTIKTFPDGWVAENYYISYYGGCVGCRTLAVHGHTEFVWVPDIAYDNTTDDYIIANGNGGYSDCYQSWHWNEGFPGWHTQTWCGFGAP